MKIVSIINVSWLHYIIRVVYTPMGVSHMLNIRHSILIAIHNAFSS